MQYIIFAAIAVVGLAFLIIYNIRVDSSRKKAERAAASQPADNPAALKDKPEAAAGPDGMAEAEARPAVEANASESLAAAPSKESAAEETVSRTRTTGKEARRHSDHDYREALRNFGSANPDQEEEKLEEPPPSLSKDQQFRDALRSIQNKD
ncbi:hypothetical protein DVH26_01080 [Paenibacillus sp. H1-7]|uniref:hypothetical protein n=1 Tax=Paenibacillus sp. H1-7 TaxID=2282849 RepID=UPI001EF88605|nr:hypothetical protein [Paenibacillus sp. H1-7]ULL13192.1 hypothetical protein DVH26_01080 [Paenibacillus sp. H1-7]